MLSVHQLRQNILQPSIDVVYTYDDMQKMNLRGTILGVIGDPVGHSLSPYLHQGALKRLAVVDSQFLSWQYLKFHIQSVELRYALPFLHGRGVKGLNVTLPHKQAVIPWLSRMSEDARFLRAVNCLTYTPSGYVGDNFDVKGFMEAVKPVLMKNKKTPLFDDGSINWAHLPVVIWGCGGAARACLYGLIQSGIKNCYVGNRSIERLESFQKDFSIFSEVQQDYFLFQDQQVRLPENALWIQATPLGFNKNDALPIDLEAIGQEATVYDLVYSRESTPFVQALHKKNILAEDGKSMLLAQARQSLIHWTDHSEISMSFD